MVRDRRFKALRTQRPLLAISHLARLWLEGLLVPRKATLIKSDFLLASAPADIGIISMQRRQRPLLLHFPGLWILKKEVLCHLNFQRAYRQTTAPVGKPTSCLSDIFIDSSTEKDKDIRLGNYSQII